VIDEQTFLLQNVEMSGRIGGIEVQPNLALPRLPDPNQHPILDTANIKSRGIREFCMSPQEKDDVP
jgi:hypothetical protein